MYASKLCISNMDLTRVLLNYGQSPGVEEKDLEEGNTPLHWAVVGGVQSPYALSPILRVRFGSTFRADTGFASFFSLKPYWDGYKLASSYGSSHTCGAFALLRITGDFLAREQLCCGAASF